MTEQNGDPLDLFRNLPEVTVDDREVEQMQSRVHDLIRVQELEREHSARWQRFGSFVTSSAGRIAAAVLLLVAVGGAAWQLGPGFSTEVASAESILAAERLADVLDRMPLVEELETFAGESPSVSDYRASHSVYEIDAGDLDLVMIVGADLDL